MPSEKAPAKAYLFHIRDNIVLAQTFLAGFDYERFRDTPLAF